MRVTGFPRKARGARGPQIGPRTFHGSTAADAAPTTPPRVATAIGWSQGPGIPAIELWCFKTGVTGNGADVHKATSGTQVSHFLDTVPEASAFQPPAGHAIDDPATINALKAYAASAYITTSFGKQSIPVDWSVAVLRPFGSAYDVYAPKIEAGVYAVSQLDRPTGEDPVAWVWVTEDGGREIWLHHRFRDLGGFQVVGEVPQGETEIYASTHLVFDRYPANTDDFWSLDFYLESIEELKALALEHPSGAVTDPNELVAHDFRVDPS